MRPRLLFASLLAAVATLIASSSVAPAEDNRVLPFWSQPFPTGFTRNEASFEPRARRCRVARRRHAYGDGGPAVTGRCPPVLHARD